MKSENFSDGDIHAAGGGHGDHERQEIPRHQFDFSRRLRCP